MRLKLMDWYEMSGVEDFVLLIRVWATKNS